MGGSASRVGARPIDAPPGKASGTRLDAYRANVRSAIKRIRNKFRELDSTFSEIENYTAFGYCWGKQGHGQNFIASASSKKRHTSSVGR
jgi:hypothetical protein